MRPVRRDTELSQGELGAEAGLKWRRQGLFALAGEEISRDQKNEGDHDPVD